MKEDRAPPFDLAPSDQEQLGDASPGQQDAIEAPPLSVGFAFRRSLAAFGPMSVAGAHAEHGEPLDHDQATQLSNQAGDVRALLTIAARFRGGGVDDRGCVKEPMDQPDEEEEALRTAQRLVDG